MLFWGADVRTRVYVDGFNLYYGALKGTAFKWLDPVLLTSLLLPPEYEIEQLGYFTARVSGKLDPRAPARQRVYLKALATLAEVESTTADSSPRPRGDRLPTCRLPGGGLTRRSR